MKVCKYTVKIVKGYEESWVGIFDENGNGVVDLPLREPEVLNWLEKKGLLEDFVLFMTEKMLKDEWIDYWEEIKYKWEFSIEVGDKNEC